MALSEVCRICLCVNVDVRMLVLKKTGLQNLYKTLTNNCMNDDERPIIVCVTCHARLDRCRRLQQQAIESNTVVEQLLAGGSTSIPKLHGPRDEIQFTPIYQIDIWPVECVIENDCKDEIFSLDSIKVEKKNFENEYSKFEINGNLETEQTITLPNNFSEPSGKKIKSNFAECKKNNVRKENLDFENSNIKVNPKVVKDSQPINNKGMHPINNKVCSQKLVTKDILAKHISYSHKTQKNSDTTAVHTQVEQQVPQLTEIFNCDICEFKTSLKHCILAHLKAHVAKQVYCCNNCDYKCIQKSSMQTHMKIHTGEKPFTCNSCEYKCITKSNLRTHMKVHTGEKPFSCNICEYKCIRKYNLKNHLRIHTKEKPFSCDICEYKCTQKSHFNTHMKIHTGEKPYSCDICEFKCRRTCNLKRHKNTHRKSLLV